MHAITDLSTNVDLARNRLRLAESSLKAARMFKNSDKVEEATQLFKEAQADLEKAQTALDAAQAAGVSLNVDTNAKKTRWSIFFEASPVLRGIVLAISLAVTVVAITAVFIPFLPVVLPAAALLVIAAAALATGMVTTTFLIRGLRA